MKIWELEEGLEYQTVKGVYKRCEDGYLRYRLRGSDTYAYSSLDFNDAVDLEFIPLIEKKRGEIVKVKEFISYNPKFIWICQLTEDGYDVEEYSKLTYEELKNKYGEKEVEQYYKEEEGYELWMM